MRVLYIYGKLHEAMKNGERDPLASQMSCDIKDLGTEVQKVNETFELIAIKNVSDTNELL